MIVIHICKMPGHLEIVRRTFCSLNCYECYAPGWPGLLAPLETDAMSYKVLAIGILLMALSPVAAAQPPAMDAAAATGAAWSPYLVGALIGILSMFTFYFSNKPLGASSAYAKVAGLIARKLAPRHLDRLAYYRSNPPAIGWEVMLVAGIIVGAFLAAWTGGETTGRWLPPMWVERFGDAVWLRLVVAFAGGAIMAFGARLAGGCTSGHGISGALQLSVGSWIALLCFFIGGVAVALPLYRL
jgi:uncharacterized protein